MSETLFVGGKFPRDGYEKFKGVDSALMGNSESGFELLFFLNGISDSEELNIREGDMEFRLYENIDRDCILNIIRFGSNKLIFDFSYDPTKLPMGMTIEQKKENVLGTNALHIVLIDSSRMTVRNLRLVTIPDKLLEKWQKVYKDAFDIDGYSEKYTQFINQCYRYSVDMLWDWADKIAKIKR